MGDTRRGLKRVVSTTAYATTRVLDKIQARDDIPQRARNVMGYVDKRVKQGAKEAERALDSRSKKKTSHGYSHKHSSRPSGNASASKRHSKRPQSHPKQPKGYTKPPKGYPKPPKGYPKPPKGYPKPPPGYPKPPPGYPAAKPSKPGKYYAPAPSKLTLKDKIVQKVMDPRVRAKVEKGEVFIRKQVAKKLNPMRR